jgi:8-oxo-dGTP pyrophosphatase MutT (NUDIX family)
MADNGVPVRDAATVVLIRDALDGSGIEAWLLTRVTQMAFAAGMSVFPGGRVDDTDAALPFAGDLRAVATRFDCSEELARALVGAAVRETFEETGVLLTVPPAPDLAASRAEVEAGTLSFGDLLESHGLAVDVSALLPWSRWVTPEGEVRRYDTRFFIGALPEGAEAQDVTSESSAAAWLPIGVALEQAQRGERQLLPPTMITLMAVQAFATVADVLASAADGVITPIRPNVRVADDGSVTVQLPDGSVHPIPRSMMAKPKPAGQP